MIPKIASITVLYNPGKSFQGNILSYAGYVDDVIIINNSDNENSDITGIPGVSSDKLHIINYGKNFGIARALNDGTKKAIELGAEWILTMDQDSCFNPDEISRYIHRVKLQMPNNTSIAGPNHDDKPYNKKDNYFIDVDSVITSGCIFHKKVFEATNGFDEKLFIDDVDHEFCYHAKSLGFNIQQWLDIKLSHKLGNQKDTGIGIIKFGKRIFHSNIRLYFMVRNGLYIQKKYGKLFPISIKKNNTDLIHRIKNHLLFGEKRWKTFKLVINGYLDYKRKKFGNPFYK